MSESEYTEEERKEIGEDRYEAFCKARKEIWAAREAKGGEPLTLDGIADLHVHDEWSQVVFATTSGAESDWILRDLLRLPSINPINTKEQNHEFLCENRCRMHYINFQRLVQMLPSDCMDYYSVYLHHGNGRFYLYDRGMVKQARQTMRNAMKRPCNCPTVIDFSKLE